MTESWVRTAACATKDPRWFDGDSHDDATKAAKVCAGCPVIAECLADCRRTRSTGIRAGRWNGGRGALVRPRNLTLVKGEKQEAPTEAPDWGWSDHEQFMHREQLERAVANWLSPDHARRRNQKWLDGLEASIGNHPAGKKLRDAR